MYEKIKKLTLSCKKLKIKQSTDFVYVTVFDVSVLGRECSMNTYAKKFIGTKVLSEYLDVSINTLRYWIAERKIPYFKIGKRIKFNLSEIERWLKGKKMKTVDELL